MRPVQFTYYKKYSSQALNHLPKSISDNFSLGEKIRYFRKRSGLSQMDLEMAINTATGQISRIENNVINPTKETILQISLALELDPIETAYLFGIMIYREVTNPD